MRSHTDEQLRQILTDVLGLKPGQAESFDADTGLFGHLPELDSMAVAGLLTEMEDRLDILIEDDEVGGDMLETYGGLLDFVTAKRAGSMNSEQTTANAVLSKLAIEGPMRSADLSLGFAHGLMSRLHLFLCHTTGAAPV